MQQQYPKVFRAAARVGKYWLVCGVCAGVLHGATGAMRHRGKEIYHVYVLPLFNKNL